MVRGKFFRYVNSKSSFCIVVNTHYSGDPLQYNKNSNKYNLHLCPRQFTIGSNFILYTITTMNKSFQYHNWGLCWYISLHGNRFWIKIKIEFIGKSFLLSLTYLHFVNFYIFVVSTFSLKSELIWASCKRSGTNCNQPELHKKLYFLHIKIVDFCFHSHSGVD